MGSLTDELREKSYFYSANGVSTEKIEEAEKALGLKFAEDYKEYLTQYGVVSFGGHELTGICDESRLNVVNVTLENREKRPDIDKTLYVIEEANIDGIVIWQDVDGKIYQSGYKESAVKVYDSLLDYVCALNEESIEEGDFDEA